MDGNGTPSHTNYDYDVQQGEEGANPAQGAAGVPGPNQTAEQIAQGQETTQPAPAPPPLVQYGNEPPPAQNAVKAPPAAKPKKVANANIPTVGLMLAALAVIVIIGAALLFLKNAPVVSTTTATTSIYQANFTKISGCGKITKPGAYVISADFNTTITGGACIEIDASGVSLVGNEHYITGSGPYSGVPPYTYGILLNHVSNVSVTSIFLSRFSYGIFMNGTEHSTIGSVNVSQSTLAGMYMVKSGNNTIEHDEVSRSLSTQGGINIASGGNNLLQNDSVINNAYYGVVVNTTGNKFYGDAFGSNPADLVCNATSAFKYTNTFNKSTCAINDYCEFATCKSNIPFNLSIIRLYPGNIGTCGSIYTPGNYVLSKGITTSSYLNSSNPLSSGVSCIKVFAPNVRIDCKGNSIDNSGYGIYLSTAFNTTVSNCALSNDGYGFYANGALSPQLFNNTANGDTYGAYFKNVTGGKINGIRMRNDTYGVFLNASFGVLFGAVTVRNNSYGIYTAGGGSNIFNGGIAFNNTKADVYCSPEEFNSTTDLMQNVQCGITDCMWATCNQKTPPLEKAYPIGSCMNITYSGRYALKQNVLAQGTCINVRASNVTFDCGSHSISGNSAGSAFTIANASNVTLSNCNLAQFAVGVAASNSDVVGISNMNISSTATGISIRKVSLSNVAGVTVKGYGTAAFVFNAVNTSVITRDVASRGAGGASGFLFTNSNNNLVFLNNATSNPSYGFSFSNSRENSVFNNSAFMNTGSDYLCSGSSTGLYSEPIAVDFGLSKSNCNWLVEVAPVFTGPQCAALSASSHISFGSDMLYTAGATCFSLYTEAGESANNTDINCNGHIMYSTSGGTFVNVVNASNVQIHNCVLVNFTTGVSTSGKETKIFNNSITMAKQAIVLRGSQFASVTNNRIQNTTNYGVVVTNSSSASLMLNNMYSAAMGINVTKSTNIDIENNTLSNGVSGLSLRDSTLCTVKGNSFTNMVVSGLACYGSSTGLSSSNLDQGGNMCTNNMNCTWAKSTGCKP